MDNEDLLRVEGQLLLIAQRLAITDVVDNRHFRRRKAMNASESLLPPRERVLEKIRALDRRVAIMDDQTFRISMETIKSLADHNHPDFNRAATIIPNNAVVLNDNGEESFSLSDFQSFDEMRNLFLSLEKMIEGSA